jgi:hypothetical protein
MTRKLGSTDKKPRTWRRDRYDGWVAAGKPAGGWIRFGMPNDDEPKISTGPTNIADVVSHVAADLPDGKLPGWSADDLATVGAAVTILILAFTALAAHGFRIPELGARQDEAEAIAAPATRILLRHLPVPKGARGDVADAVALGTALVAYVTRLYMVLGERAREVRENRSNGVYNPAGMPAAAPAAGSPWPSANQVEGMAA